MPLPRFTLVGATTRAGLLTRPLRDRFQIQFNMEFYKTEELAEIVRRSARRLGLRMSAEACEALARRSRGTPRVANRLLRRARDFAEVEGDGGVDLEIVNTALQRLGIDEIGLDPMDRRVLDTILHRFGGGPVGVDNLATALGEERDVIEEVYEPYLIQMGLMQRTQRGRIITANGQQHLGGLVPDPVAVVEGGPGRAP
jgi:Holliday junction DNA helicase RuvB